jgi:hypothetical protein
MKKLMIISAWLLVMQMALTTAYAQEKVSLSFKYSPAETFRYRTDVTYDSQQEINGQEMKMSGGSHSVISLHSVSVDTTGSTTFLLMYDEMKTSIKNVKLDTTIIQTELLGKRAKIVFSRLGKELERVMLDSVEVTKGFGAAANASIFTVNLLQLPDHPVGAGDKWTADIRDSTKAGEGYFSNTGKIDYTLVAPELKNGHHCLKIAFVSKKETTGKIKQMGMDMVMEGTVEASGNIWFDQGKGVMVFKESTTTNDMTVAMTGQMKMSVPMTQVMKSTAMLVEE